MTTYVSGTVSVIGTNISISAANFQAWAVEISAALHAVLTQTADTGQIVPASVALPGTSSDAGYEIYTFNDARQGVDPIYVKITYARGTGSKLVLKVQVGQGSNGSGTLTGFLSSTISAYADTQGASTATGSGQHYAYHADGCFWICDAVAAGGCFQNTPRNFICVSRTRDGTGAFDGRGVLINAAGYGGGTVTSGQMQYCGYGASPQYLQPQTAYFCTPIGSRTTDTDPSGFVVAWPHFYYDYGTITTAWATWTMGNSARSTVPSTPTSFTAAPYGVSRLWLAWQNGPAAHMTVSSGDPDWYTHSLVALPWE